jgi:hypothetical protein
MFHVETTAWEGEHAWKPPRTAIMKKSQYGEGTQSKTEAVFAEYGSYFWSDK